MRHFIEALQSLDAIETFVVVCSGMMTLIAAMPWLRTKLLRFNVSRAVNDGASDAIKAVAGFTVFVVAFSLVQVQSQYRITEDLSLKEANAVGTLDRALFHFGTPAAQAAREDLQIYVKSVIEDEWPLLAHDQRSPKTDALYKKFGADIRRLEPETRRQEATETQMLRALDEMGDLREARLAATDFGLQPLYWWVMVGLFGILLVLAFFTSATVDKMLANCGLVCALGMMFSLVLIYEDPFAGDINVAPVAMKRILGVMMER
ncbi:MAG TPA: DUF4239 domain-containing protein [Reyranella sp.]|nr:DUF4239 domain-containing protein [Reyranella sp.]